MAEPYLGEIRIFPWSFPPQGWALCAGQLLPINQNQALFAILGTTYGGNGTTTFALPDLRGQVPMHAGGTIILGQSGGQDMTTLAVANLPAHSHPLNASNGAAASQSPGGQFLAVPDARAGPPIYDTANPSASLAAGALSSTGGGQPISNLQPYLCLNFCIALAGVFPVRN